MEKTPRIPADRSWWIAALLWIVAPGVSHVYQGRVRRAAVLGGTWALLAIGFQALLVASLPLSAALCIAFSIGHAVLALGIAADAAILTRRGPRPYRLRTYNRLWVYAGLIGLSAGLALLPRLGLVFDQVVSESMEPGLTAGDYVAVNRWAYHGALPQRGDVVLFRDARHPTMHVITRVIGLPGETVRVAGESVWVDNVQLAEPYARYERHGAMAPSIVQVPVGMFFVMGDNRDRSRDSRRIGCVGTRDILGRAARIYFSRDPDWMIRWARIGRLL